MITVTNNGVQQINAAILALGRDSDNKVLLLNQKIREANDAIASINKILDGLNKDANVISVNGKQGIVTLDASDVGALPSDTHIPTDPVQSNWAETDTSSLAYIENKPNLATVATSGSYSDLSNKPTIPAAQVNSDWNATSGVAEILNKPTIPTATSQLTNDSGFATTTEVSSTVSSFVPKILGIQDNNDPDNFPSDGVRVYKVRQYNIGWGSNDGFILNIPWNDKYGFQIAMDDESNFMAVRHKNGGVWSGWQRVSLT